MRGLSFFCAHEAAAVHAVCVAVHSLYGDARHVGAESRSSRLLGAGGSEAFGATALTRRVAATGCDVRGALARAEAVRRADLRRGLTRKTVGGHSTGCADSQHRVFHRFYVRFATISPFFTVKTAPFASRHMLFT